jgi:hypothetical protein
MIGFLSTASSVSSVLSRVFGRLPGPSLFASPEPGPDDYARLKAESVARAARRSEELRALRAREARLIVAAQAKRARRRARNLALKAKGAFQ